MSSAILYLAIIAIWACVLIPRWLRRDSAHGAATAIGDTDAPAPDDSGVPDDRRGDAGRGDTGLVDAGFDEADAAGEIMAAALPHGDLDDTGEAPHRPLPDPLPDPLSAQESRRRMLTARRRLLGMLLALEAAAVALAVIRLAALWVVVPPTVMLAGYLLLLREVARADAEHAQRAATAAAAARARARARAAARARVRSRREDSAPAPAAPYPTPAEGTPLVARFAAAPVPADYEDSGRDFAPGLAGKYTPSNADSKLTDGDQYGYDQHRYRRAVGD